MANQIVGPLNWAFPIVDSEGRPTPEFQDKWSEQARVNGEIPDLSNAAAVSALLDEIGSTQGFVLVRGSEQWEAREGISENEINLSDVETNDVSTERHGFAPTLPDDDSLYLDGTGEWSTPGGGGGGGAWQIAGVWDHSVNGDTANIDFTGLAGAQDIFVATFDVARSSLGQTMVRVSTDNGVSFFAGATDYRRINTNGTFSSANGIRLFSATSMAALSGTVGLLGTNLNSPLKSTWGASELTHLFVASPDPINALRVVPSGGGDFTSGQVVCWVR